MTTITEQATVVLTIVDPKHPGRPPLTMNEWRNSHWSVKSEAKHRIHWQVLKALQTAGVKRGATPNFGCISVRIMQWAPDGRKRDRDGLGAYRKDVLDALKNCGVVVDDSRQYVLDGGNDIEIDRKLPRMEIHITEVLA